jgi:hypothetical protein
VTHQVAYECGYLDATRLLKAGAYVSPFATLAITAYTIHPDEIPAYYEGCRDAVIHFTQSHTP